MQIGAAKAAGANDSQIVKFKDQPDAMTALLDGNIDAFDGTAVGNRALAADHKELETIAHPPRKDSKAPVGAFSFSMRNIDLLNAVNEQLRQYLGSADHRARMAKYGITASEIDGVVANGRARSALANYSKRIAGQAGGQVTRTLTCRRPPAQLNV